MRSQVRHVSLARRVLAGAPASLRDERGAAMVEFAIVASVLLLIVIGVVYFGRFLNYSIDETHLANEAARWAAVAQVPQGCTTTLATCVRQQASGELLNGSSDVTSPLQVCVQNGPGGAGNVGDPVQVNVQARFTFLPLLRVGSVTVKQSATMRLEQMPSSSAIPILGCSP